MAALKNKNAAGGVSAGPTPPIGLISSSATVSAPPTVAAPVPKPALASGVSLPSSEELARRIAEAKRKVAENQASLANPYAVRSMLHSVVNNF
jgi:hypothetical protein